MIEVEYTSGIKERRTFVRGDEMHNPRIKDILVYGGPLTHTGRLMKEA